MEACRKWVEEWEKEMEEGVEELKEGKSRMENARIEIDLGEKDGKERGKTVLRILKGNRPGIKVGIEKWRVFEDKARGKNSWIYEGMLGKREAFENKKEVGLLLFDSWEEAGI